MVSYSLDYVCTGELKNIIYTKFIVTSQTLDFLASNGLLPMLLVPVYLLLELIRPSHCHTPFQSLANPSICCVVLYFCHCFAYCFCLYIYHLIWKSCPSIFGLCSCSKLRFWIVFWLCK